ncbi:bifunctional hydroxymethylpyrimidine kinase/phosphomethylpyrimidine kinase [Oceanospirillum linum]|uniref:hydroxymethylpyrimidine kinase n=1 Tax=Oceanospirillum linum TaxID=966 RepID=A0A1T1H945_OCELI|nr:hydroxymethylpyrimidine/phosphomethylpyrimidine kinase [Oceanospirillum linum]OOV86250.1 hydroxymethylpyrimidine/phosphomethylpyrimidine kinase [Oceanospirillum linum]SEG37419.1 hydroxymethylpyrimidine/phosphomethylpyrimidine kinase [Oleiphilus messinensis]SMP32318.1 hydroxymethylpyrimidine/phosphomethylpyrimidine kinase [Oceanospirillum linum]
MSSIPNPAVTLVLAGHDPSGGAGIQADIETIRALGGYAATVITATTTQDTHNVQGIHPVNANDLITQARMMLDDLPISAIKIGLLGSIENIEAIHTLLQDYPHLPVVFDPILHAGGGKSLTTQEMVAAFNDLLLPHTTLLTPNTQELKQLSPNADSIAAQAHHLISLGCKHVAVTGTHAETTDVINKLFGSHGEMQQKTWPRLSGEYHGSGCTFASACTALIAQGADICNATEMAQSFTWKSLESAHKLSSGQHLPNRFFWCDRS